MEREVPPASPVGNPGLVRDLRDRSYAEMRARIEEGIAVRGEQEPVVELSLVAALAGVVVEALDLPELDSGLDFSEYERQELRRLRLLEARLVSVLVSMEQLAGHADPYPELVRQNVRFIREAMARRSLRVNYKTAGSGE